MNLIRTVPRPERVCPLSDRERAHAAYSEGAANLVVFVPAPYGSNPLGLRIAVWFLFLMVGGDLMASITLQGNEFNTCGELPAVGSKAPNSDLIRDDLSDAMVTAWFGKKILNIFPSIDTPTCATAVRTFHEKAAHLADVTVNNISYDLPFAQKRFCGSEGIENALNASCWRTSFAEDFGVRIIDGPLEGLCARAIVVVDENNKVLHTELVPEIADEPNYEAALNACKVSA